MAKARGKCPVSHIAIDTETTGLDFKRGVKPFAVSLCDDQGSAYFFSWPVDPRTRDVTPAKKDLAQIEKLLRSNDKIVMHNAKFDVAALATIGIDLTHEWDRIEDTLIASHCLDSREDHGLKPLAARYLAIPDSDKKSLIETIHRARSAARSLNEKSNPNADPPFKLGDEIMYDSWLPGIIFPKDKSLETYATWDAERTILLWIKVFGPQLVRSKLWDQYKKSIRILPVVYDLEQRGVSLRPKMLTSEHRRVATLQGDAADKALALVPESICTNLRSGDQLAAALHDHFKLRVCYRTDSGKPATDSASLQGLLQTTKPKSKAHDFISHVLYMKKAQTAVTYLKNYMSHAIHLDDGTFLFPSFNPTGTATTRFSGSNPNPQNVSKGKEYEGQDGEKQIDFKLRSVFGPRRHRVWYALDYDQLQLRIFAKASGDPRMIQSFADGYDFHTWMGCEIYQVAPDQLTKLQRRVAKNVNFGFIFGAGPRKIEESSGVKGLSAKLAKMFPIVDDYMKQTIAYVKTHGYVYTLGGYRLAVDKSKAYSGVCIVVQGTEGEIVKEAMVRTHKLINSDDFYLTLQVHDELIFDASLRSKATHLDYLRRIRDEMEQASLTTGVVTKTNCEVITNNWAEAKPVLL